MTTKFNFDTLPIVTVYVGETTRDNNWQCDQWKVSIGILAPFVTDYFTGLGLRKQRKGAIMPNQPYRKNTIAYEQWAKGNIVPVKPDNKGIMYSLIMDSEACEYSFNDWCDNFGYSSDSITAFNTYQQCCATGENLRKVFSHEQIQQMRVALEDY